MLLTEKLKLEVPPADLGAWHKVVEEDTRIRQDPDETVRVAVVGKYVGYADAYKSINEALYHAGLKHSAGVEITYVDSERLMTEGCDTLEQADAILVPGGFGDRGIEGKIAAARYAREHHTPYLGICLGMQVAVIEFARNVVGLDGAHSTEFDSETAHPVIAMITEWQDQSGYVERRDEHSDLGGTMRLGEQACQLSADSLVRPLYGCDTIDERHRHRYEFNNHYLDTLTAAGLRVAGRSGDGNLVEIIELPDHPWFIGCQFHPEFTSTPRHAQPLFLGFVRAGMEYARARRPELRLGRAG